MNKKDRSNMFLEELSRLYKEGYIDEETYKESTFAHRKSYVDDTEEVEEENIAEESVIEEDEKPVSEVEKPKVSIFEEDIVQEEKPKILKLEEPKQKVYENVKSQFSGEKITETALILGVIFILLAGLFVSTTNWDILSNLTKTFLICCVAAIFFGTSVFMSKVLKVEKSAFAFWLLGSLFIPIVFISIGYFELFGTWFSFYGGGVYALCLISCLFCLVSYYSCLKVYNHKFYYYAILILISLSIFFLMFVLGLQLDIALFAVILFEVVLIYLKKKGILDKIEILNTFIDMYIRASIISMAVICLFSYLSSSESLAFPFISMVLAGLFYYLSDDLKDIAFGFVSFILLPVGFFMLFDVFYMGEIIPWIVLSGIPLFWYWLSQVRKIEDIKQLDFYCNIYSIIFFLVSSNYESTFGIIGLTPIYLLLFISTLKFSEITNKTRFRKFIVMFYGLMVLCSIQPTMVRIHPAALNIYIISVCLLIYYMVIEKMPKSYNYLRNATLICIFFYTIINAEQSWINSNYITCINLLLISILGVSLYYLKYPSKLITNLMKSTPYLLILTIWILFKIPYVRDLWYSVDFLRQNHYWIVAFSISVILFGLITLFQSKNRKLVEIYTPAFYVNVLCHVLYSYVRGSTYIFMFYALWIFAYEFGIPYLKEKQKLKSSGIQGIQKAFLCLALASTTISIVLGTFNLSILLIGLILFGFVLIFFLTGYISDDCFKASEIIYFIYLVYATVELFSPEVYADNCWIAILAPVMYLPSLLIFFKEKNKELFTVAYFLFGLCMVRLISCFVDGSEIGIIFWILSLIIMTCFGYLKGKQKELSEFIQNDKTYLYILSGINVFLMLSYLSNLWVTESILLRIIAGIGVVVQCFVLNEIIDNKVTRIIYLLSYLPMGLIILTQIAFLDRYMTDFCITYIFAVALYIKEREFKDSLLNSNYMICGLNVFYIGRVLELSSLAYSIVIALVCILLFVYSAKKENQFLLKESVISVAVILLIQTADFWGSLPWWVYLLIVGLFFLGWAVLRELKKKE